MAACVAAVTPALTFLRKEKNAPPFMYAVAPHQRPNVVKVWSATAKLAGVKLPKACDIMTRFYGRQQKRKGFV
ncbi:hypothetical protein BsWGS_25431 [Bradybaena similaris]